MRAVKTVPEMASDMLAESASASYQKKRIYKAEADAFKKETLQADISRAISTLASPGDKVDLQDEAQVRERIIAYLNSCSVSGTYPTVQGLASFGFGISRQALNQWRLRPCNIGKPSALLIDQATEMFGDILTNESLHNNANPVQAIFQLKNSHGFSDKVELQQTYDERDIEEERMRERGRLLSEEMQRICDEEGEDAPDVYARASKYANMKMYGVPYDPKYQNIIESIPDED